MGRVPTIDRYQRQMWVYLSNTPAGLLTRQEKQLLKALQRKVEYRAGKAK